MSKLLNTSSNMLQGGKNRRGRVGNKCITTAHICVATQPEGGGILVLLVRTIRGPCGPKLTSVFTCGSLLSNLKYFDF